VVLTLKDCNLIHSGPPFGTQQRGSGRLPFSFRGQRA
jgi:hypothetical protein